MSVITFKADSTTLTLNGTVITDFVEGDVITLNYVNPATSHQRSLEGLHIQERSDKKVADLTVRVPQKGDSYEFFRQCINNTTLLNGTLKESYLKDEEQRTTTYELINGTVTTQAGRTINTLDGNNLAEFVIRVNEVNEV